MPPVEFRNVTRYVESVEANVPLYEALGFEHQRSMGEHLAVLQHPKGLQLVLHTGEPDPEAVQTSIGATITGTVDEARAFMTEVGFDLVREPQDEDEGFFYVYADLSGNPVTLVGERRHG